MNYSEKISMYIAAVLLLCSTAIFANSNAFSLAGSTTNDDCIDAISIPVNLDGSCTMTATGTTDGATYSASAGPPNPACFTVTSPNDIWFSFVVPAGGAVNITYGPMHEPLPIFTLIEFYTGSCGSLSYHPILGCNLPEAPVTGLTPGETVFVRTWYVFGSFGSTVTMDLCVSTPIMGCIDVCATNYDPSANLDDGSCILPSVPNSTCATASTITAGSHDFYISDAMPISSQAFCGFDSVGLYYNYVVPPGVDTIEVVSCGTEFHGTEVLVGCGPGATLLTCTNTSASSLCTVPGDVQQRSIARVPVSDLTGTTLTIRVNALNLVGAICGTLVITEFGSGCDATNPPANLTHQDNTPPGSVTLSWDPIPQSVGCQVRGTRISPAGPSRSKNILAFEPSSTVVPYSILGVGTTWEWKVRCTCDLGSPPDATAFSTPDVFFVPSLLTGLPELRREFDLYPNPADAQIVISLGEGSATETEILVADITGRVIENTTVAAGTSQLSINVADYPNGLYIVRVDGMSNQKFEVLH